MFCSNCGKEIDDKAVICIGCGVSTHHKNIVEGKSWLITLLLCIFVGCLGIHRFYIRKIGTGISQLILTLTFYGIIISGIWAIMDLVLIVIDKMVTKDGKPLVKN